MNYEKQNFNNGEVLEAKHLNYIEEGIEQAYEEIEELGETISEFQIAQNIDILELLFKKRSEEG
jgi:hypothetical protein